MSDPVIDNEVDLVPLSWPTSPPDELELKENQYAKRIRTAWSKSIEGILETGQALIEAKAELQFGHFEHLVKEQVMKRLLDDQFDDCGLTLKELRAIENSIVKSLTAVYHGRVKYPSQQTA